jgi:formate hydrogenlyase subunit 3/multisubunit Na+/H+ antiporter MnhD subunit
VTEIGLSLLAVGLGNRSGIEIFFALLLPRGIVYFVWGTALAGIRSQTGGNLQFSAVGGLGLKYPFLTCSLILAHLSLAGLPLLAGFPVRLALWEALALQDKVIALGTLLGTLGLIISALRSLAVLVVGEAVKIDQRASEVVADMRAVG